MSQLVKLLIGIIAVLAIVIVVGAIAVIGGGDDDDDANSDGEPAAVDCSALDASELGPLVVVTSPISGARVDDPVVVEGCAATFEQNVVLTLSARDGTVLAEGFATADAPLGTTGAFRAELALPADVAPGLARLDAFEEDASEGEGDPPPRDVVPVVIGS